MRTRIVRRRPLAAGRAAGQASSLATIAVQPPANLPIVALDNERDGQTGMQATHAAHRVDLAGVAAACGFANERDVEAALPVIRSSPGPILYVAKVRAEPLPFALPPKNGAYLRDRFRHALLGISFS